MEKKDKSVIVTLDYYNQKYFRFKNRKFEKVIKLKYNKKDTYISYISNTDLIIEAIDLSESIPKESIADVVTDKVYEELKLDIATEYEIVPVKTAKRENNKVKYQTLIINLSSLKEKLSDLHKKITYIDYIIAAPLLYKVLFVNKKIENKNCNVFLYFGESESFITFYYKGEYLYSKTIKYSINYIYDRVCQLAQEVFISREDFIKVLATEGLKTTDSKLQKLIIQVFDECFLNLNDVLIYTKRVYDIEKIDNFYVGFSFGYIDGIASYSKNYLNITAIPISSLYSNVEPKQSIDPLHSLMLLNAIELKKGTLELPNFTPYPKPAPLFKRPAGKLIQGFIAVVILFLIPIIYNYATGIGFSYENKVLSQKEAKLAKEVNHYKKIISKKKEELKALDNDVSKLKSKYNQKKGELDSVYNKKFNYSLKSEQLALITDIINSFDIKSKEIEISDSKYLIELESKDDKEITAFIKKLVKSFNNKILNINIENIKFDKNNNLYKGVLKVEFLKG